MEHTCRSSLYDIHVAEYFWSFFLLVFPCIFPSHEFVCDTVLEILLFVNRHAVVMLFSDVDLDSAIGITGSVILVTPVAPLVVVDVVLEIKVSDEIGWTFDRDSHVSSSAP